MYCYHLILVGEPIFFAFVLQRKATSSVGLALVCDSLCQFSAFPEVTQRSPPGAQARWVLPPLPDGQPHFTAAQSRKQDTRKMNSAIAQPPFLAPCCPGLYQTHKVDPGGKGDVLRGPPPPNTVDSVLGPRVGPRGNPTVSEDVSPRHG